MFCSNCGNKLDDNAKFCPNCGSPVGTVTQSNPASNATVEGAVAPTIPNYPMEVNGVMINAAEVAYNTRLFEKTGLMKTSDTVDELIKLTGISSWKGTSVALKMYDNNQLREIMENLVTYLESPQSSKLIQIAIAHAQFEMIHPFKDGNGRVGRILIPLFLYAKDKIPAPIFYISRYFTQYNDKYKKYLSDLSKAKTEEELLSNWKDWLNYFLEGIKSESKQHVKTSQQIIELYRSMVAEINKTEMIALVDMLFNHLTITPTNAVTELNLPDTSIRNELKKLAAKGYITRVGSARKTKYIFTQLIKLLN